MGYADVYGTKASGSIQLIKRPVAPLDACRKRRLSFKVLLFERPLSLLSTFLSCHECPSDFLPFRISSIYEFSWVWRVEPAILIMNRNMTGSNTGVEILNKRKVSETVGFPIDYQSMMVKSV